MASSTSATSAGQGIDASSALPPGTYLLGGRGSLATQPWPELLADLTAAVAAATAGSAPERAR
jgi:hypothetical protein